MVVIPCIFTLKRDVEKWLGSRSFVNVTACRVFRIPLGAGFAEKYNVSPLRLSTCLILGHCFDVVSLGKSLNPKMLHLTQAKMSTW